MTAFQTKFLKYLNDIIIIFLEWQNEYWSQLKECLRKLTFILGYAIGNYFTLVDYAKQLSNGLKSLSKQKYEEILTIRCFEELKRQRQKSLLEVDGLENKDNGSIRQQ